MIGETSKEVLESIISLDTGASVFLAHPDVDSIDKGEYISVYLLEVKLPTNPVTRDLKSLSILLRYLVTTYAQGEVKAHNLLEEILKAVWLNKDYQLELVPPSENLWLALGVSPRPCIIIEAFHELTSIEDESQVVTKDLVLEQNLRV